MRLPFSHHWEGSLWTTEAFYTQFKAFFFISGQRRCTITLSYKRAVHVHSRGWKYRKISLETCINPSFFNLRQYDEIFFQSFNPFQHQKEYIVPLQQQTVWSFSLEKNNNNKKHSFLVINWCLTASCRPSFCRTLICVFNWGLMLSVCLSSRWSRFLFDEDACKKASVTVEHVGVKWRTASEVPCQLHMPPKYEKIILSQKWKIIAVSSA